MAGRVLGQCFLKNHRGCFYRAMIGLLLLVITVPTLAVQSALAAANPLTNEEQAWLKAHPNIELGYPDAFEPAVIVNEDGSYRGTLVDILALLNQRLGTDFKLTVKSIPDIISQVSRKELGGVLSIHPSHADKYGWLKTKPYMNSYPTVFTRKGHTFTRPSDLAGKKIAVIDKIFFSQKLVDLYGTGSTLIKVKNSREGLERVRDGTADLYIGSSRNSYLLSKYQFFDLAPSFQFYKHPTPNVMAVRSDWPQLVSILNKGLAAISVEEIESILRKWIGGPEQMVKIELTDEEQTWLDQNRAVRVRTADWPPYMITREDGPPQGIAAEYLNLIKKRTGVNFEYEVTKQPFAEFLEAMKQRSGPDMTLLIARTPAREEYFSFTTPYITTVSVIFAHEEDELIVDINGLAGKALAVPRGYNIQNILAEDFPNIKLVLFDSDYDALKAVALHKADAYIGNLIVASHIIHQYGLSGLKVLAPAPPGEQTLSMGIRKDWPQLTSIIDKALASITEAEKTAIRNKYVALRVEQGFNRVEVLKWVLLIAGGAFGVVIFFAIWNRTLTKRIRSRTAELESSNQSLVTEVAERTKAEKALGESRNYLENLMDSMPDAVFSVKMPERVIEWANDTYNVLGYEPGECVGKTTEFLYPDRKDFIVLGDRIQGAIAVGDEIFHVEQTLRNKSGEFFPADINVSLFRIDERVVSVTAIVRDITNRKRAEQEIQLYQERLKALAAQLTIAEERERQKIAADLHDHVGHSLALARMQLNGILESDSDLERHILVKDVSSIMLQALQETRSLIFELSTPSMNAIGLGAAISEWLEEQIEKRHGLQTECSDTIAIKHQKTLDENVQTLLFRSVRELLTNVVKHARANKVAVHLGEQGNDISITIEDDGIGFDRDALKSKNGQKGGFGLFSIQERMTNMGGTFDIQSEPGKGCRVVLSLPVGEDKRLE